MTKPKHTPGPWVIEPDARDPSKVVISGPHWDAFAEIYVKIEGYCRECDCITLKSSEEGMANASIIAAAPEMLAALEMVRREFWEDWHSHMSEEQFNCHPVIEEIDAAINKAKGRK